MFDAPISTGSVCIVQDFRRDPFCLFERRHRGSANRQLIPANDPKCVVIHYSEDQLASSFKNFVVIHSVFSGVITENQRIAPAVTLDLLVAKWHFFSKKKEHLIELAEELGLISREASLTKPKLKDLIVKSPDYIGR
ncbi:hypothetical protein TNCV_2345441 [Trichonephila clavipes]|nr:hypothetical protein TNCV_2345441 [Trichonephila clavipes]